MASYRYPDDRNREWNRRNTRRRRRKASWHIENPLRFSIVLIVFVVLMVMLVSRLVRHDPPAEKQEASSSESEISSQTSSIPEEAVPESKADSSITEESSTAVPEQEPSSSSTKERMVLESGYRTTLGDLDDQIMGFMSGMLLSHADNHPKKPEDSRAPEKKQYRYHIVIDPSHGGEDSGPNMNGIVESNFTLLIAARLRDRIRELDPQIEVILTRDDDSYVETEDRIAMANERGVDFYLNLHCTAYEEDPSLGGVACMFWDTEETTERGQKSLKAAMAIVGAASNALERPDLGAQLDISEILYQTEMPAVALRMGYLTNDYDRAALTDDRLQGEMVDAVAAQIVAIVNEYEPHVDVNIPEVHTMEESSENSSSNEWSEDSWTEGEWSEDSWNEGEWSEDSWTEGEWSEDSWNEGEWSEDSWNEGEWSEDSWNEGEWSEDSWNEGEWSEDSWNEGEWSDNEWSENEWTQDSSYEDNGWE